MNEIFYNRETCLYGRFKNIAIGFVVMMIWTIIIMAFYHYIDPPSPPDPFADPPVVHTFLHNFFFSCISAPLWEEVVFRWFPLYLTRKLAADYKIPIILATSAIFGYLHGGASNVWIQGIAGLVLACVYIKNDYHYWSPVILHFLWNYMVLFGFHNL